MGTKIIAVLFVLTALDSYAQNLTADTELSNGTIESDFAEPGFLYEKKFMLVQDFSTGKRKDMLKGTGSFYPAKMLNKNVQHVYLGGHLEYFFDNRYSFRGDIYTLISEKNDPDYSMQGTTQLSAGFNRSFAKGRWNPFVGIYTGVTRMNLQSLHQTFAPDYTHPSVQYLTHVGLTAGVQYYFYKYFHFFAEARYIHQLDPFRPGLMDELSFSGGLGFQIP